MMPDSDFHSHSASYAPTLGDQGTEYLDNHRRRLLVTLKLASNILSDGDSILSIGAGPAYVESFLTTQFDVTVTVADFPEIIHRNQHVYENYDFETVGVDVTDGIGDAPADYDLVLACEVIEHLTRPPEDLFGELYDHISVSGRLLVSTPNFANLLCVFKLLKGDNPLASPEEVFSDVTAENEGVHRREYVPDEIVAAMENSGMTVEHTEYTTTRRPRVIISDALTDSNKSVIPYLIGLPIALLVPRFRETFLAIAKK